MDSDGITSAWIDQRGEGGVDYLLNESLYPKNEQVALNLRPPPILTMQFVYASLHLVADGDHIHEQLVQLLHLEHPHTLSLLKMGRPPIECEI